MPEIEPKASHLLSKQILPLSYISKPQIVLSHIGAASRAGLVQNWTFHRASVQGGWESLASLMEVETPLEKVSCGTVSTLPEAAAAAATAFSAR